MSTPLAVAACLLLFLAAAHSYLGERYLLKRLFKRPLPPIAGSEVFSKQTLRFAWHLTSLAWLGFAALLYCAPSTGTVRVVAWTFLISAAFPLIATKGKHFSWIVFLAIAGCCFLAV